MLELPPNTKIHKLSVLMAIYNERGTLERIVRRVLAAPVELELELIAVDDCSTDGSWEILQALAQQDARIIPLRNERNRGKGFAIRTAIRRMTGQVAIVQDADLEYDPAEYPKLLQPILEGKAEAVFGSRFTGHSRRAMSFWHGLANRALTLLSNLLNNLNLTDMETGFKAVRADVLRNLRLAANTFTFEPELTTRLAQWGARVYEVPVTYAGRTVDEGKKIRPRDGLKAVAQLLKTRFCDTRFTNDAGFAHLTALAKAPRFQRWMLQQVEQFVGQRVLEVGAGIGSCSNLLLNRKLLFLVEPDPLCVARLNDRFGHLPNVRVEQGDGMQAEQLDRWQAQELDTVLCTSGLERAEDDAGLIANFARVLQPGGHCVLIVPAEPGLFTKADAELGRCRRYQFEGLRQKLKQAGLEVVYQQQFNKLGACGWYLFGKVFGRARISSWQTVCFDRLLWLAKCVDRVPWLPGGTWIIVGRKASGAANAG